MEPRDVDALVVEHLNRVWATRGSPNKMRFFFEATQITDKKKQNIIFVPKFQSDSVARRKTLACRFQA
jgi:hypothetical protein